MNTDALRAAIAHAKAGNDAAFVQAIRQLSSDHGPDMFPVKSCEHAYNGSAANAWYVHNAIAPDMPDYANAGKGPRELMIAALEWKLKGEQQ